MFDFFKKKTVVNTAVKSGVLQNNNANDRKPFQTLHDLAERNHDVFGIFLFLAKLDNRFMACEKEAIAAFAIGISGCQNICSDDIEKLYGDWPKPSIKEFRTMLSNISVSEPLQEIVKTCEAILGRQSNSNPMAKILMDEIRSALSQHMNDNEA